MTTITIDNIDLKKKHFNSVEEFQQYLIQHRLTSDISSSHKELLDARIADSDENPDHYLSIDELKSSIKRK